MNPVVSVKNLSVAYEDKLALEDITFELKEQAFLSIIGPNGSGKTTLLKALLGMVRPVTGIIRILGYEVPSERYEVRKQIGYVPQRERIDPTKPVLVKDVVLMGRIAKKGWSRRLTEKDHDVARRALEMVEMNDFWDEPYAHLSGGQQQRVLIARALATEPKLLLLDEPLSGVDAATQDVILNVLREEADRGVTVIMVTHDLNPLIEVSDYVMLLNRTIIAMGRSRDILNEYLLSRTFMRRVSVIMAGEKIVISGADHHA
ncbi:MAG: metal ABC transporter ATP-binding protein [Candidatus Nezhaarchaeales archaeon]